MAALDEANVEKKFRGVVQTQESIQSLTLWVIHHKAHHEKIVELWFGVLKKSKMSHRLTMFYLCNDIVQTCKRKHAIIYKDAFKDVLKDAVLLVRDNEVRGSVERIFNIWEERSVYDAEFLEELAAILNNTKVRATINSKLLAEFKPQVLMDLIMKMKRHDDDVEVKTRQLSTLRLDASNVEAVKLLKDRAQGKEFCQQFEDSCTKLENFVSELDQGLKERTVLIELLEQSELFHDTQYGEAKIVANAYKNFGTRVNNLRKRLEEHKKLLDNPLSPVPSPSMDAPSPGNTPPLATDDILEAVDMDLSDEEGKKGGIPGLGSLTTTKDKADVPMSVTAPGLITADMLFTQMMSDQSSSVSFQTPVSSETPSPMETLPWAVPPPPPPPPTSSQSNSTNLVQLTEGSGTPVNDEGRCTPVQDEKPDGNLASNPIEFLTQLISQSQKGQGGANASFFESLTSLTKKVDNKVKGDETNESTASAENPDGVPPPPAWEPWTTQPEVPTPSYVPDTRPTPAMPFADATISAPYASSHSHQYTPDGQGHLYTESHHPSEPYTVDSHTGPQPYIMEPKPEGEGFPVQDVQPPPPGPPPVYGLDFNQPPPPQPYGAPSSGPPPPPPQFNPDIQYGPPPGTDQPPPFNTIPPPPPSDPPMPEIGPGQGQYPPPFYQDAGPQAPSPDTPPEGLPGFPPPPPPTSWGQPFAPDQQPLFMPPVSDSQSHDAPYLPPGITPPTTIQSPALSNEGSPQFSVPQTSGPPDQPPMFALPPGQGTDQLLFNMPPGPDHPFNRPPPPGSQEPPFNNPQAGSGEQPPFNMPPGNMPPGNMPPGNMPPGNIPPGNMPPGNQEQPHFGAPQSSQGGEQPPFGGPPGNHREQHFSGPPSSREQPPFGGPPGNHREQPPFGVPQSSDDQPPYGMPMMSRPQDSPHMNMPGSHRDPPFGMPSTSGPQDRPPFNMPPSGPQDPPPFDTGHPHGQLERPPFNRQGSSGPQDQRMDFGPRGLPSAPTHNEGPHLRGILRPSRHNNLTTIQTMEFDSPSSNSDQDGTDVSSIPTMVGKRGPNRPPPRPPSQPPTPQSPGAPVLGAGLLPSPREEEDQQEFIDKLKRKKSFTPTSPVVPPKGILKNVSQGIRNLRTLTEVSDESKDGKGAWTPVTDSGAEGKQGDSKGVSKEEEPNEGGSMDMDIDVDPHSQEEHGEAMFHHHAHRPPPPDIIERRRSLDSPRRGDHMFDPYGDRRGRPPFPRFAPRRPPPPFDRFRDNFRPFPKRLPPPPFDYRHRQFPRY